MIKGPRSRPSCELGFVFMASVPPCSMATLPSSDSLPQRLKKPLLIRWSLVGSSRFLDLPPSSYAFGRA
jgi:hypothetical protein